jgi:squalene-hopene/tetraprenyl-beta-curcumene cyclase
LIALQNSDGGWAPMVGSCGRLPSEPGATGAVLAILASRCFDGAHRTVHRAVAYLRSVQAADGCWTDSRGNQRILCTSNAVRGLLAAGAAPDEDAVAAAINWLIVHQQPDGAWNASPTESAWALRALAAAGRADHTAARRAVEFLLHSQDNGGNWTDEHVLLHDPISNRHFRNDLHSAAWPLLAMSEWVVAASSSQSAGSDQLSLRLVAAAAEN